MYYDDGDMKELGITEGSLPPVSDRAKGARSNSAFYMKMPGRRLELHARKSEMV
jgi:hypothetical protein